MKPCWIVGICIFVSGVGAQTPGSPLQYTPNTFKNVVLGETGRRVPVGNEYGRNGHFVPLGLSQRSPPVTPTTSPRPIIVPASTPLIPASVPAVNIVPITTTPATTTESIVANDEHRVLRDGHTPSVSLFDAIDKQSSHHHLLDDSVLAQQRASAISFGPDLFRNFLNQKQVGSLGGIGGSFSRFGAPYFVPVPIVIPPPPPPPPGPKCYTNPSGYLCCNATLEHVMTDAYLDFKRNPRYSFCNVQKMATVIQDAAEKAFMTSFETLAAHKDFVAKSRFSGDLNCKIEIDGKYFLAYATPNPVTEDNDITIIDANSLFGGGGASLSPGENDRIKNQLLQNSSGGNGTSSPDGQRFAVSGGTGNGKPTYLIYGPIR